MDYSSSGMNHHHHHHHHHQTLQTPLMNLQSFDQNSEIYNLTSGMEMIGFPSKNQNEPGSLFYKPGSSSSSKSIHVPEFYDMPSNDQTLYHQRSFIDDDQNLRSCVFPCEGNERPSQGLSLSLNSSNLSTIGLQSFELRHQQQNQGQFFISNSRFLGPAQELLNEFCSLGNENSSRGAKKKMRDWGEVDVIKKQGVCELDFLELQKRKTKLIQMLEEVDRRYKHYCDQMKSVVSSFESIAGNGSALVYSTLASRAMSRHFRCLRDAIVAQIKVVRKSMGEKDSAPPGTTKGETPRLRVLDQTLRQHRAFQQMNMMETHPWRPQRGLPERSVSVLRAWLFEHFLHPYPSDVDKHILARQTGLSRSQVSNWFINARVRLWKPMVEEMYLEELKEHDEATGAPHHATDDQEEPTGTFRNIPPRNEDQKPTHDQLIRIDSECLSSIINNPEKNDTKKNKSIQIDHSHNFMGGDSSSYGGGAMELDFSSYNHYSGGISSSGGGSGVSLTLGLHQNSLFNSMEDIQTVHQYSLLDGENLNQTPPYRNLMGAQLLRDLAG